MRPNEGNLPDPILITGCARSGTSMVAGAINICGAFGGMMSGPNRNNQKGMFENSRIREEITKPYLRGINMDPMGQYPLPDIKSLPIPSDWRAKVEEVIRHEGYKGGPWFYKGAKMCLFWPVWHYAFPRAKWIIVRRRSADIADSCLKTAFMRAFRNPAIRKLVGAPTERDGWIWWIRQHLDRFREMQDEGLNTRIVWPERMVDADYEDIKDAIEWLGLKWDSKVLEFIDPKLWKARRK